MLPFYAEFARRLADGLDGVVVHAVGHAGFGFDDHNDGETFDLDDQIDLKILYLEQLLEQTPGSRLVLIGHSVGAYMVMEIVKRRADLPVDNAALLFPALCDLRVAWPVHVLKQPIVYEALARLVSLLPDRWKAWVAMAIPQIRHEAAMISAHCNAHTVRNVFALVRHELEVIRDLDAASVDVLNGLGRRLLLAFTRFDAYVPPALARRIRDALPGAVHVCYEDGDDVQHAFVLKDTARVAHTTLQYLFQHGGADVKTRATTPCSSG